MGFAAAFAVMALGLRAPPHRLAPRAETRARLRLSAPLAPTDQIAAVNRESINWEEQWYPVASTRVLHKKEPNALVLLDHSLVAWNSQDGWRVAEDRCPHRGAPLSYGRLESNATLTCSYHGWQFAPTGKVSYQPTVPKDCAACLRVHPSRVCEHGLLWVWPKPCPAGSEAERVALETPLPNEHLPPASAAVTDWTLNRVPVSWAALLENTLDDAHGVHAHHGLAFIDRSLARPADSVKSGESGEGERFVTWCNVSGKINPKDAHLSSLPLREWTNSYRFMAPHRTTVRFGPTYRAEGFIVPAAYGEWSSYTCSADDLACYAARVRRNNYLPPPRIPCRVATGSTSHT